MRAAIQPDLIQYQLNPIRCTSPALPTRCHGWLRAVQYSVEFGRQRRLCPWHDGERYLPRPSRLPARPDSIR